MIFRSLARRTIPRSERFLLNPTVLSFGEYSRLHLIHSNSGDGNQTSFGTADIVFYDDYLLFWAP